MKQFLFLLILSIASFTQAQEYSDQQQFPKHSVYYTVFNSTFVLPEIAEIHKIKRSTYESLLNISVYKNGETGTVPAQISGTYTNLLQQQKTLNFIEIVEDNAVYYLAPVRVGDKEILHFHIAVTPTDSSTLDVKFTKTVYADK